MHDCWKAHFCLNGNKNEVFDWCFITHSDFINATEIWPYDVIDSTDNEIWFDFGDDLPTGFPSFESD